MRNLLAGWALSWAALCGAAVVAPTLSNVAMHVPNGAGRTVTVTYDLAGADGIVTCDFLTNGVSVGHANIQELVGDVNRLVAAGSQRSFTWKPYRTWTDPNPPKALAMTVVVTAWAKDDPPDYMVTDLVTARSVAYYPCAEALPGGVGDARYKTTQMVFRRIPAAGRSFTMGSPATERGRGTGKTETKWYVNTTETPHTVAFTNDFWLAIYELTEAQYQVLDSSSTDFTGLADGGSLPKNKIGRYHLTGEYEGPKSAAARYVASSGTVKKFSDKTALQAFLPTDAEWEFACRAGTTSAYPWGGEMTTNAAGANVCLELGDYAWYDGNAALTRHPVGLKKPNPWGLYDMLGNVCETVADRLSATSVDFASGEIDPVISYAETGWKEYNGACLTRGGSWWEPAAACRSAARTAPYATWGFNNVPNNGGEHIGARLSVRIF